MSTVLTVITERAPRGIEQGIQAGFRLGPSIGDATFRATANGRGGYDVSTLSVGLGASQRIVSGLFARYAITECVITFGTNWKVMINTQVSGVQLLRGDATTAFQKALQDLTEYQVEIKASEAVSPSGSTSTDWAAVFRWLGRSSLKIIGIASDSIGDD